MSNPSNPFWWCQDCRGVGWIVVDYERNMARRCPNCNRCNRTFDEIRRGVGKD